jgi:hypothetical protein
MEHACTMRRDSADKAGETTQAGLLPTRNTFQRFSHVDPAAAGGRVYTFA